MRFVELRVPTFHYSDLPDPRTLSGFAIYRGVLIQWDADQDSRVFDFLDGLPTSIVDSLLVARETEGMIDLRWKGNVPEGYEYGSLFTVGNDLWTVNDSRAIRV